VVKLFRQHQLHAFNKAIDWDSDNLRWTLHTATYTPNQDTHDFVDDLTNELGTSGGYTVGGIALATPTSTYTAANSWGTQRAATTAYAVDDVVRPASANGFLYRCAVAGTTGAGLPTYETVIGKCTTDGTVTWETAGAGIQVFGCTDPTWSAPFTAGPCRYAVLSDRQTGVNSTSPLIGYVDFGVDKTGGGGAFTVTLHAQLRALHVFLP
jgi:hypothetical protein